jgi:predicted transcriptional regulator
MRIYDHIEKNPGGHLRGIKDTLGLSMGVLTHHIGILEREEMIKSRDEGMYKRYYPYKYKIENTPLLTGSQKAMMDVIKSKPGANPDTIADGIGKSRKTVYYHIQELEAKGQITIDRSDGGIRCFPMRDT